MKTLIYFLLLPLLLLAGCKNQQKNAATQKERLAPGLQWTEVVSGSYCGIDAERHELIRSAEQWASLWGEMQAMVDPVPPLPSLDFESQVLLACFMGTRNSGGYEVLIESIEQKGSELQVQLVYVEPGKNCVATMALTQPYLVVALENPGVESAVFSTKSQKRDCEK